MNKLFSESICFFAMNAATGKLKWTYTPEYSIRHNTIAIGNNRVYLIDRPQAEIDRLRNPHKHVNREIEHPTGKLVALDAENGQVLWENEENIYGTLLALSTKHDALVMTYQYTRNSQFSELGGRMTVFDASNGSVIWDQSTGVDDQLEYRFSSRPIINDRTIYLEPFAWDLLTGEKLDYEFSRSYGCGIISASKYMLVYRSATLGYYDLVKNIGTENFGGIRPGCWINAIPAGGLVLMPDATDRCNCSYLNKATIALKPY
ncbi:MAG TPA: hypothetical protein ENH82_20175 [bacterium]|nr:hypothetical protein [bacterium]